MKKHRLKKLLKLGILLFGMSLILNNCHDESLEVTTLENVKNRQVKFVLEEEIPDIINFLESNTTFTKNSIYSRTLNTQNSSIDIENAVQVIDTLGNTNYSFFLNVNDHNPATFYNLITHQSEDNTVPNAYVYEYEVNQEHLQEFIDNWYSFSNFSGTIKRYSLNAFLESTSSQNITNRFGAGIDDCICEETSIDSGGPSGGGSTGGGNPNGDGSPGGGSQDITCNAEVVVVTCNGGGQHDGSDPSCTGSFQGSTLLRVSCSDGSITDYDTSNRGPGAEDDCNNPCEDEDVGEVAIVVLKPLSSSQVLSKLGLKEGSEEYNWWNSHPNQANEITSYLNAHWDGYEFSQEAEAFIENVIAVMMANPDANPLLGADCSSFEYAQPPGALQKGCAVSGFDHSFYVAGITPNGSPYYGDVSISMSIAYFTMPTWMTNGLAANHTAEAVTNAIRLTDLFYFENPDATASQVQNSFNTNLTQQLGIYGGTISGVEPFPIPSPAPYLTSFFGAKTDCN